MPRRAIAALLALAVIATIGLVASRKVSAERQACKTPDKPLRYAKVKPVFGKHCGKCHDGRTSTNQGALRVFDSARYPFVTERPDTLLADLEEMFESRSSLSDSERCAALNWLKAGALDDRGKRPPYTRH